MNHRFPKKLLTLSYSLLIILTSCSVNKQISKQANTILLKDSSIATGHIGISIYEPATGKYWYEYNSTHYFIPASNTKLFTLYAGMKYLGDSLVGIKYQDFDTAILLTPTADPTFLHPDFKNQPIIEFLKKEKRKIYISDNNWKDEHLGKGWSWNDYNDDYMAERNSLPIYGNVGKYKSRIGKHGLLGGELTSETIPKYFQRFLDSNFHLNLPAKILGSYIKDTTGLTNEFSKFGLKRKIGNNDIEIYYSGIKFTQVEIPFYTDRINTAIAILKDQFNLSIYNKPLIPDMDIRPDFPKSSFTHSIKSQPSDSLFKPMMHRSDNFFAEQTLLMASNEHLGYMSDEKIIDTILKTDLKDVPQRPKWVDGSGLSRYNLFTPKDFVYILNKMQNEFGLPRMKVILATGGEGTLSSYFKKDAGFIYAKTGTLSNNCALSGYLITNKGKLLIFSILANNYISGATPIRRAEERFLEYIREKY